MANFKPAFELMIGHEGGYVNDPSDPGGETYKGVARKIHPDWSGWPMIDLFKTHASFPSMLDGNTELQGKVESFYLNKFWLRTGGDLIKNQDVAESIFDFGVNAGVGTSVELAQKVVGAYPDGKFGIHTADAINAFDPDHFLAAFALAKIARYVSICKKRPESKKYFFGWVCRALNL